MRLSWVFGAHLCAWGKWFLYFWEYILKIFNFYRDFSQINKVGLDYNSHLTEVDSDQIALINLGQEEKATASSPSTDDDTLTETKPGNSGEQYQSELKVATLDNVAQMCSVY